VRVRSESKKEGVSREGEQGRQGERQTRDKADESTSESKGEQEGKREKEREQEGKGGTGNAGGIFKRDACWN
jgi:hypothetical protein